MTHYENNRKIDENELYVGRKVGHDGTHTTVAPRHMRTARGIINKQARSDYVLSQSIGFGPMDWKGHFQIVTHASEPYKVEVRHFDEDRYEIISMQVFEGDSIDEIAENVAAWVMVKGDRYEADNGPFS
jgi:hypothetical protein